VLARDLLEIAGFCHVAQPGHGVSAMAGVTDHWRG
jgi:hypothetical protein